MRLLTQLHGASGPRTESLGTETSWEGHIDCLVCGGGLPWMAAAREVCCGRTTLCTPTPVPSLPLSLGAGNSRNAPPPPVSQVLTAETWAEPATGR